MVIDKAWVQQVWREWRIALIHGHAAQFFGHFNVSFNLPGKGAANKHSFHRLPHRVS
jgi:hypothetical protein